MNGAMGLQLGGCIGKAIGLTTESRVKAVAGPRRKQGIEYFDTGRVSAKAAATTVGETSARCAGSGAPLNGGSEAPLNGAVHEEEGTDNAPSAAAETGTNSQGNGLAQAASMTDGTDQSAPDSTMPNKTAEDDHCAESVFAAMVAADSAAAQLVSAAPAHNSKRTIQGRYEGLSATLLVEQAAGRILGIRASQKGPQANYFRFRSLLDTGLPDHASYAWKGLYTTLQDLQGGFLPLSDSRPTHYRCGGHDTDSRAASIFGWMVEAARSLSR
ncbi:hypothetical protein V6N11_056270 [Hibiscus sabdariffa]|uniref:Uncharacterized protein n=1 Tax=Hibiscus sabdariffa TaxID=183260 RepID=A0ABR2T3U7_9ROSI